MCVYTLCFSVWTICVLFVYYLCLRLLCVCILCVPFPSASSLSVSSLAVPFPLISSLAVPFPGTSSLAVPSPSTSSLAVPFPSVSSLSVSSFAFFCVSLCLVWFLFVYNVCFCRHMCVYLSGFCTMCLFVGGLGALVCLHFVSLWFVYYVVPLWVYRVCFCVYTLCSFVC